MFRTFISCRPLKRLTTLVVKMFINSFFFEETSVFVKKHFEEMYVLAKKHLEEMYVFDEKHFEETSVFCFN